MRRKLVWPGHMARHNSLLQYLRRLVTPWSAEVMLDGQLERANFPAHARTADKALLQKRLEEDLC